ncbi:hypothetical protein [Mycobacteroides immunogenum]|uniref:Transmembrane protein n=1 Tax=Mycobacteroides immunogenum TaxID=83262 RepID=A0A7V8LPJ5_9MYCO|nr:hypothetical protein [Mycobacteroides immunogenum]AMT69274.1 membrane protein [Mycobacteroides immunogenum]ANO02307.1 hypothetical protein BAB75_01800 [Mycobacteroides immunogenum]KIU38238.1 membrane protein [Mycobacteroides immunogenum]KPG11207.1 hypothetical protein AN908_12460 [Mycobacteroides immunogenum]KPG12572.1 hypothetical protein AN909_07195 [Mycobacteroides immunogenum]
MAAGRRTATIALTSSHAALSLIAGLLFFFFALPRWPELNGATGHSFGTGMRIIAGVLLAAAGVPALLSWRRTRRPEFATPQLALTLRAASFTGHFLAGALIIGTAIAEIWLDLDRFGIWEFAVYGAAAAIGLLAFSAYQLAVVAERPAPAPKARPAKKKTVKGASTSDKPEAPDEPEATEPAGEASADAATEDPDNEDADTEEKVLEPARGLRNRRTPRS